MTAPPSRTVTANATPPGVSFERTTTRRRGAGAQRERHAVPGEERNAAAGRAPLRDERGFRVGWTSPVKLAVERVDAERRQADAVRRAQPGDGAARGGGVLRERVCDGA